MQQRPTLGALLGQVGSAVQNSAARLVTGAAQEWLEANRAELLHVIATAQTERAAALLQELCTKVPLAAGLISMAMNGSPEMAIAAIGIYSPPLAEQLAAQRDNVVKLQEYWRRGAEANRVK